MTQIRLTRSCLRAPLKTDLIYLYEGHIFKGKTLNTSEKGLLIHQLPHFPKLSRLSPQSTLHLMLNLPQYPLFQSLSRDEILSLQETLRQEQAHAGHGHLLFSQKIIRLQAELVRSFEERPSGEAPPQTHLALKFGRGHPHVRPLIHDYICLFAKNIIFLLGLFESLGTGQSGQDHIELIRFMAKVLGHFQADKEKISNLRQKILHDYQGLKET